MIEFCCVWVLSASSSLPSITLLSGSHGPHELCVQQATEAHWRLLLPDITTPQLPPEDVGVFLPGLRPHLPGPPCPWQQPPPPSCSPWRGEPRGEEASNCSCPPWPEGALPGSLQDGHHNGLFLPLWQSRCVHERAEVLHALHVLHPSHLYICTGNILQWEHQGGEMVLLSQCIVFLFCEAYLWSNKINWPLFHTDQTTQPRTNRWVERLDAASHPHLSHIWS